MRETREFQKRPYPPQRFCGLPQEARISSYISARGPFFSFVFLIEHISRKYRYTASSRYLTVLTGDGGHIRSKVLIHKECFTYIRGVSECPSLNAFQSGVLVPEKSKISGMVMNQGNFRGNVAVAQVFLRLQ